MDINYRIADDSLHLRFSKATIIKDVSYNRQVTVRYDADWRPAEITIHDLSMLVASKSGEDESTLVLTERETHQLEELAEYPPERSAHFGGQGQIPSGPKRAGTSDQ